VRFHYFLRVITRIYVLNGGDPVLFVLTRELSALIENNVVVDPSDRTRTGRRSQVYEWI